MTSDETKVLAPPLAVLLAGTAVCPGLGTVTLWMSLLGSAAAPAPLARETDLCRGSSCPSHQRFWGADFPRPKSETHEARKLTPPPPCLGDLTTVHHCAPGLPPLPPLHLADSVFSSCSVSAPLLFFLSLFLGQGLSGL
jgi:hypothetical protein